MRGPSGAISKSGVWRDPRMVLTTAATRRQVIDSDAAINAKTAACSVTVITEMNVSCGLAGSRCGARTRAQRHLVFPFQYSAQIVGLAILPAAALRGC